MQSEVRQAVLAALNSFLQAKAAIERTFAAGSAPEIVAAVLQGRMPRQGRCDNGLEYFVHGVGYTVVTDSGGPVHIDGTEAGDVVSVYDLRAFFESAEIDHVPNVEDIRIACNELRSEGILHEVGRRYSISDEGVLRLLNKS